MSIHDEIQEMLPGYVLSALEPDEAERVGSHLASCQRCTRVLDEYAPVATALALAIPAATPPRDLKARTMLRALSKREAKRGDTRAARSPLEQLRAWFVPAFAGTALLLALAAFGWSAWQSAQMNRQFQAQRDMLRVVAYEQGTARIIHGTEKAPAAVGRLYLDLDSTVAALVTVNLPPIGDERVYQVWLTAPDGSKDSGGVFQIDTEGNGLLLVRSPRRLDNYIQVGVTDEPAGGSRAPTTKPVLLAALTSP